MRKSGVDERRGAPIEYRLKLPEQGEVIGTVAKTAGATKFFVDCSDGKQRLCSIPGRFRRRFWVKENDVVIVKPWVVQSDIRGDIVWRYSVMDINKLREKQLV
ncbi:MAG: translation initiation factor IF-1A [Candidatus Marsarchaeota archaeon]|jgi:translation initiation factor 1A|nr:translation initiation factor IF-1A [Candidatus Marsarchaeota archaeon]MCL5111597.1 translation initiation factor IF-1A [Candidatus Marsarchaeota archaeon]